MKRLKSSEKEKLKSKKRDLKDIHIKEFKAMSLKEKGDLYTESFLKNLNKS